MDTANLVQSVVVGVIVTVIAWMIKAYGAARKSDERKIIELEYQFASIKEKVSESASVLKDFHNWQTTHTQDSQSIRQHIFDGLKDIKSEITLLKEFIERDIKDHDKRIEALEKKIMS